MRPLGNYTDKAWLAGWDASIRFELPRANPYKRRPQAKAWLRGHEAATRSDDAAVLALKNVMARRAPLSAPHREKSHEQ